MKIKNTYSLKNIVTVIAVTMFFSCNDSFKQVQKIGISENEPIGVDYKLNLKYTDSGKVIANLLSTKALDYTNRDFPFREFVEGVTLYHFDQDNKKSTILADYAIVYEGTNLIDLQGNVVITTSDSSVLRTNQLYYDRKTNWIYTNEPVSFHTKRDIINGNGFDSNKDFTNAEVLEVTGIITLED